MTDFTVSKLFVLAGRAILTIHNGQGTSYTYKIKFKAGKDGYRDTYFVSLLTGPDNQADYTYLGLLNPETGKLILTRASRMNDESLPVKVFRWAIGLVWADKQLPEGYGCHPEGRCGRCGRPLTAEPGVNPEGERFGFGPTCWAKIQGEQ